jgi:hypothetical protein
MHPFEKGFLPVVSQRLSTLERSFDLLLDDAPLGKYPAPQFSRPEPEVLLYRPIRQMRVSVRRNIDHPVDVSLFFFSFEFSCLRFP